MGAVQRRWINCVECEGVVLPDEKVIQEVELEGYKYL